MKKLLIVFVAILAMALTACGGGSKDPAPEKPEETETPGATATPETPEKEEVEKPEATKKPAATGTPEISKGNIEETTAAIKDKMMMKDATVKVDKNKVNLAITVIDDSIDVVYAQETGEEFASLLASNFAAEYESAEKLWSSYDLTISIGTDDKNVLWEGVKATDADAIKWKNK